MKVQIEGNLYLESDETQYYLKEYSGKFDKKSGAPLYKILGYYSKPEQAFQKILNILIASSDAETLEQLVKDIKQTREYIKTTLSVKAEGA
ncbi:MULTISPECIES: hypothetical protein [Bacillaceae]|uniref:hypothetical protein n=1 Tax=Shouchella oshimensis TaxID=290588 RepID=UPI0009955578|nr:MULTISPECIES: hypothetical protein [Bacillaceae]